MMNNLKDNCFLKLLIVVIISDIVSGTFRAFLKGRINSSIGLSGLIRHTQIILINILMVLITPFFDVVGLGNSILTFYIIQYGFSIIENLIIMEIPIPEFVYKRLEEREKDGMKKYERNDENDF